MIEMTEFTETYRKWHAENNGKYDSAWEYHKSLMSNFKDWQPPKKLVEVPKFVADWLDYKGAYIIATSPIPKEVLKWSQGNTGFSDVAVNISNLIEIKVTGYTVEKEQLYEVVFSETEDGDRYLLLESDGHFIDIESMNDGYYKQQFTEAEIKAIDERYWAFAVKVEEVES